MNWKNLLSAHRPPCHREACPICTLPQHKKGGRVLLAGHISGICLDYIYFTPLCDEDLEIIVQRRDVICPALDVGEKAWVLGKVHEVAGNFTYVWLAKVMYRDESPWASDHTMSEKPLLVTVPLGGSITLRKGWLSKLGGILWKK